MIQHTHKTQFNTTPSGFFKHYFLFYRLIIVSELMAFYYGVIYGVFLLILGELVYKDIGKPRPPFYPNSKNKDIGINYLKTFYI